MVAAQATLAWAASARATATMRIARGTCPLRIYPSIRHYSNRTKTKIMLETEALDREIKQLEKSILKHERESKAQREYISSLNHAKEDQEAASSVYKSIMAPKSQTHLSVGSGARSQKLLSGRSASEATSQKLVAAGEAATAAKTSPTLSALPTRFLEDLKLSFLDTRGIKQDHVKKLNLSLPTVGELSEISKQKQHAASAAMSGKESTTPFDSDNSGSIPVAQLSPIVAQESSQEDIDDDEMADEHMDLEVTKEAEDKIMELGLDKWNKLIYLNALEGRAEQAEEALKLMAEVGVKPDLQTFDHLMDAYANAGDLQKAKDTLDLMTKTGLVPNQHSYNALMKCYVAQKDLTSAFELFDALKVHHPVADIPVFTTLIKGCVSTEAYDTAWKVFDQMRLYGQAPDEVAYSLMIHACAKTKQVEKALNLFEELCSKPNMRPTDVTFNSLVHACAKRPDYFTTAFALLHEMQNVYGFEPDIKTYNSLLFACANRKDLLTARKIFQKVAVLDYEHWQIQQQQEEESEGGGAGYLLRLDEITLTNMFWCYGEWKAPKGPKVHLKNLEPRPKSTAPEAGDVVPVKDKFDSSSTELAIRSGHFLLPEIPPKTVKEAVAEADMIFKWFSSPHYQPFSASSSSLPPTTDMDSAEFDQDQDVVLPPGTGTLGRRHYQQTPTLITTRLLNSYLSIFVKHNRPERALQVYNDYFEQFQRSRDSFTYSIMLEGCYLSKNVDLGAQVFESWREWRKSTGLVTDHESRRSDYKCYVRMVNLLARTRNLREGVALLEELALAAAPRPILSSVPASGSASHSVLSEESTTAMTVSEPQTSTSLQLSKNSAELLPIYPDLKDFSPAYAASWTLEDEPARIRLLELCKRPTDRLRPTSTLNKEAKVEGVEGESEQEQHEEETLTGRQASLPRMERDKRLVRRERSIRGAAIKWKGEMHRSKEWSLTDRRMREVQEGGAKRGWGRA